MKFVYILLAIIVPCFHCLIMYLPKSTKRCVSQELDNEDSAVFTFGRELTDMTSGSVVVSVTDPDRNSLYDGALLASNKPTELKYNAKSRGPHHLCFTTSDYAGDGSIKVFFNVDFKSRTIRGGSVSTKVSSKELPTVESNLLLAEESILDISSEVDYARRQEIELRTSGELIADRIQWFGILSIFILLTVSVWQVIYLRHFFTTKKLL